MADPMRIRAQAVAGNATVRVLMSHEMETGQRRDAAGKSYRHGTSPKSVPRTTASKC